MERIAVYGKGGIGKSVVATGLTARFAIDGRRVLHVGCDPKRDSCLRLIGRLAPRTAVDLVGMEPGSVAASRLINKGRLGVQCIEAGGPDPGLGCGGRGVARAIELIAESELLDPSLFDVAVFDVLGDVVCGGFAAPLRRGFARKVLIVVSDEPMALFAANNIAKAVLTYGANGVVLAGLVANLRGPDADLSLVERFAGRLGTRILGVVPRDPMVLAAERLCLTVVEHSKDCPAAQALARLAREVEGVAPDEVPAPTPLSEGAFFDLIR